MHIPCDPVQTGRLPFPRLWLIIHPGKPATDTCNIWFNVSWLERHCETVLALTTWFHGGRHSKPLLALTTWLEVAPEGCSPTRCNNVPGAALDTRHYRNRCALKTLCNLCRHKHYVILRNSSWMRSRPCPGRFYLKTHHVHDCYLK